MAGPPSALASAASRASSCSVSRTFIAAATGMAMSAPTSPSAVAPISPATSTATALRLTVDRRIRGAIR